MNHNLSNKDKDFIHMKECAVLGLVFAMIGSVISAMQHLFGWTIGGLLLVGFNLALLNYTNKTEE